MSDFPIPGGPQRKIGKSAKKAARMAVVMEFVVGFVVGCVEGERGGVMMGSCGRLKGQKRYFQHSVTIVSAAV
jgi:hypothetical protein